MSRADVIAGVLAEHGPALLVGRSECICGAVIHDDAQFRLHLTIAIYDALTLAEPAAEQAHAAAPTDAEAALARVRALADRWDAYEYVGPTFTDEQVGYATGWESAAGSHADDLRAALSPADHDRRNT